MSAHGRIRRPARHCQSVRYIIMGPLSAWLDRCCLVTGQRVIQRLITARTLHPKSSAWPGHLHYAVCFAAYVANMLHMGRVQSKNVPRPNLSNVAPAVSSSVGTGPGLAHGSLRSHIISICLGTFYAPESFHVWHLLCCFCLFHINHTSHQPQKRN